MNKVFTVIISRADRIYRLYIQVSAIFGCSVHEGSIEHPSIIIVSTLQANEYITVMSIIHIIQQKHGQFLLSTST